MENIIYYCGNIVSGTKLAQAVYDLMVMSDKDFIPPLSDRSSATKTLAEQSDDYIYYYPVVDHYYEIILGQKNIIALVDEKIVAFMSFRHDFEKKFYFPTEANANDKINYVTTLCANPDYRGRGLAKDLYDFIENKLPKEVWADCVATRTWHTNESHIKILQKRGYKLTCTLHKERFDKVGFYNQSPESKPREEFFLDTVYYCKSLHRKQ